MRKCPYCACKLEDDQLYCPVCGAMVPESAEPVLEPEPMAMEPLELPETEAPLPARRRKPTEGRALRLSLTAIVLTLSLALAVTMAVLTINLLNSRGEATPNGQKQEELPTPETEQFLYVTGVGEEGLPLRSELGENGGEVLTQLLLGAEVTLVEEDESAFCYVFYSAENLHGYAKKYHLTPDVSAVCGAAEYYVSAEQAPIYQDLDQQETVEELTAQSVVMVLAKPSEELWYILSDGAYGYVEAKLLSEQPPKIEKIIGEGGAPTTEFETYHVVDVTYYLALRSEQAHSTDNEIGALYEGEDVQVIEAEGDYWYVYSPKLKMYGYANSDYLAK